MVGQVLQEEQRQLPWLENGDRLSRPEFERRYAAMAQDKKAELIDLRHGNEQEFVKRNRG